MNQYGAPGRSGSFAHCVSGKCRQELEEMDRCNYLSNALSKAVSVKDRKISLSLSFAPLVETLVMQCCVQWRVPLTYMLYIKQILSSTTSCAHCRWSRSSTRCEGRPSGREVEAKVAVLASSLAPAGTCKRKLKQQAISSSQ